MNTCEQHLWLPNTNIQIITNFWLYLCNMFTYFSSVFYWNWFFPPNKDRCPVKPEGGCCASRFRSRRNFGKISTCYTSRKTQLHDTRRRLDNTMLTIFWWAIELRLSDNVAATGITRGIYNRSTLKPETGVCYIDSSRKKKQIKNIKTKINKNTR